MAILWLFLFTLFGVFAQTVAGFGIGLILMPPLSAIFGLDVARPLAVLIGTTNQVIVLYRTRQSLTLRTVGILSLLALVGLPIGNWIAESAILSEDILLTILALIVVSYALYALVAPVIPYLKDDRWGSAFGFISGVLTGAYNTGGPPIVIYANARRWTPDAMRSNLQGFFLFKGVVLLVIHAGSRNFTTDVVMNYIYALPAIGLGLLLGFWLYPHIPAERFRQFVLVFLLVMGISMLWGVYS